VRGIVALLLVRIQRSVPVEDVEGQNEEHHEIGQALREKKIVVKDIEFHERPPLSGALP
jgi:hypothetical protein